MSSVFLRLLVKLKARFRGLTLLLFLLKWLLISASIGLMVGSASALFLVSLDWVTTYRESHPWLIALLPLGGLAIGWVYHYWGKEVEAGNNLLLETIQRPRQIIPLKMAPLVVLGTLTTHLLGGSAGREGTALQMGASLSDQLTRYLGLSKRDHQLVLIAGLAAGFGSVFGTPLAGALFSLEVVLMGRIQYQGLFPALASAVLADATTRAWNVSHTHYPLVAMGPLSPSFVFWAFLAGVAFGLASVSFIELTHFMGRAFKKYLVYPPFRPLVGGFLVAASVGIMGTTRYIGLGIPTLIDAFSTQLPLYDFAFKLLFTALTLGAAFKGGEVTPLFFIGATLGNALSLLIPLPRDLLAALGFVAVFAGAANTPLACTLMAIELFGADCGIYALIACVAAYYSSGHRGIYGSQTIGVAKHSAYHREEGKNLTTIIESIKSRP